MSQTVNLSISGIDISLNDYQGLPPGALNVADNAEIRYANLAECRRGFEELTNSAMGSSQLIKREIDFPIGGVNQVISLSSAGALKYYDGTGQVDVPGDYSAGIINPDDQVAKSRFIKGQQNLYVTTRYGIRSLCSGSGSDTLLAGVPQGLDISGVLDASVAGFLEINQAAASNGQYIASGTSAVLIHTDLVVVAATPGSAGNLITLEYTAGGTAGSEIVTVTGNAISVLIQSGVSTAQQVANALTGSAPARALVTAFYLLGTTAQTAPFAATNLSGGIDSTNNIIQNVDSTTNMEIGQFIYGDSTFAFAVINSAQFIAKVSGAGGNAITIQFVAGGSVSVAVSGNAITITIISGSTTGDDVAAAVNVDPSASALVVAYGSPIPLTAPTSIFHLSGGSASPITDGTTITAINDPVQVATGTASLTGGSTGITSVTNVVNILPGDLITGEGIVPGTKILFPPLLNTLVLDTPVITTGTLIAYTVTRQASLTLSAPVNVSNSIGDGSNTFFTYNGSETAYRVLFGRVETDENGNTITRLGTASARAIVSNTSHLPRNVDVAFTLPKNALGLITFYQLFRAPQTADVDIVPLDQYKLAHEAQLTGTDFTNRVVTINDDTPDALLGVPLYSGSDQEGSSQENGLPPSVFDMCTFRDFALYGNVTRQSTLKFTVLAVGPGALTIGNTITISGTFEGNAYSEAYMGDIIEDAPTRKFLVVTSGTPSQNITDTVNSLIRVINYDEAVPVHAILLSTSIDLPGQILLQSDYPTAETFTVSANTNRNAYDPFLFDVVSDINIVNNGIAVSKSGELEAVPALNLLYAGTSTSPILRLIALRDYVIVIKSEGVYKISGLSPNGLSVVPFDLTTNIMGPDTAVSFNSAVWMFSNQGIVSITDSGVESKSIPVDADLNALLGAFQDNIIQNAFAISYETDRKYILCLPKSSHAYAEVEYCYNYVTDAFTTWSRSFTCGFVHQDGRLYVAKATGSGGILRERKSYTALDFVDEAIAITISSQSGNQISLTSAAGITVGDVLYQTPILYSLITAVDTVNNIITILNALTFTTGASNVLQAIPMTITWKQSFGDNPAFVKQFSEGQLLFKRIQFLSATMDFVTDFSPRPEDLPISGYQTGQWGLFGWGLIPWGGTSTLPLNRRFYIPQNNQMGSYILPTFSLRQGFSNCQIQGCVISYYPISQEVGK